MALYPNTDIAPHEIRAIREKLGLTQVEAGELLGGGPRAFTKYEAGKVRPAASIAQLLRLLDANPNAVNALRSGGAVIAPVAPVLPFEVAGEHIAALTAHAFTVLLRRLLSLEAQAHGLPEYGIHVADNISTADGGEDARIEWKGGPEATAFLPSRFCQYQLKAGEILPSTAAKEVVDRHGDAKPMVRSALERGAHYILLCAHPYTQQQIEKREKAILGSLRDAGLNIEESKIHFHDSGWVASWVNRYPSVALWVKEQTAHGPIEPFRSWNDWAKRTEHESSPWVEDERLPVLRTTLQDGAAQPRRIIRVVGASGVGKSRLVLEALAQSEDEPGDRYSIADLVLYADEAEFGSFAINRVVQTLAENRQRAVVVVDSCPPETHRVLAGMARRNASRLSLITVDHEIPPELNERFTIEVGEQEAMVRVPEAPLSVVEAVIEATCPGLPSEDFRRLAHFSRGFPKIGRLVAQAWARSQPVAHATEEHLAETFVLGHQAHERDKLLRAARLLAAFRLVRVDRAGHDLVEVAAFGRELSARDLHSMFVRLVERGVALRRGRYVTLQPPAIAACLAERQWREWIPAERDSILGGNIDHDLKVNAAKQLALLNTTETAREIVRQVCRPGGPFDGRERLLQPRHTTVLRELTQVDTSLVADRIERSFQDFTDLSDIKDEVRRDLVWALEKIAFDAESFESGAQLLLRLALAENEPYGNNATGQFAALFPVLLGNTVADGPTRLRLLEELSRSDDRLQRGIVVDALIEGSTTHHFSRAVGAEIHGARPALAPWHPVTRDDALAYIQGCVEILADFATGSDAVADAARSGLGQNLRSLASVGFIDLVEDAVCRVGPKCATWPEALEALGGFLRYDVSKVAPTTIARVHSLIDQLTPQDLSARVRFLVTEMSWDYLRDDIETDHEQLYRRQVDAVRDFAAELLGQPEFLKRLLPQLSRRRAPTDERSPQRMTFPFGYAIAELADSPMDWLKPITEAVQGVPAESRDFDLLSGYLSGLPADHAAAVETFKQEAARSTELAPALPLICWRLGLIASDIDLAQSSLLAGLLPPWRLTQWSFGGTLARVDAQVVAPLFDQLLDHGLDGYCASLDLMGMYAFGRLEVLEDLRPQLRKAAENLTRWSMLRPSAMEEHHFGVLMKWLLEKGREDPDACAVASALSRALDMDQKNTLKDMIKPAMRLLLGNFPEISWQILGQSVLSDPARAWRLGLLLGSRQSLPAERHHADILSLPEEALFAWCRANPGGAPAFAAAVVPILANYTHEVQEASLHPWIARLLNEFGDNQEMLNALHGNIFSFLVWGSPTAYFALYEAPLGRLRDEHSALRVRCWAKGILREIAAESARIRTEDEEWEAQHQV